MAENFNPTATPWSSPCGTPLGSPGVSLPRWGLGDGRSARGRSLMVVGCHLCWVSPPFRCHICLDATSSLLHSGATSAQMPPLLRYHLCSGTTSTQMSPKLGGYVCSDATSSWVPPPLRCHLCTDATLGVEESRARVHGSEEAAVMLQGTTQCWGTWSHHFVSPAPTQT